MRRSRQQAMAGLDVEVQHLGHGGVDYRFPCRIADRYEVTGILAAGGFGVLLTARDQRIFRRKVLIKANRYGSHLFQHPNDISRDRAVEEQRKRLTHEMKMLRVAQQRNVAGAPVLIDLVEATSPLLYGPHHGVDGKRFCLPHDICMQEPYLILSFIEGETLEQACARDYFRRNLLGNVKSVAIQLAGILTAFHRYTMIQQHELAFIYQDLKPENVIWTRTRNSVLIDFGSFAARGKSQVVPHNLFVSTPPYQPPEFVGALAAEESLQPTADVYSLGVTILHLLRGSLPVSSDTGEADLSVTTLDLPDTWQLWLQKTLSIDPRQRFATMQEAQKAAFQLPTKTSVSTVSRRG